MRVLDLPADAGAGAGVFDTLHEFATGQALADHLKASVHVHYGHPLRAFVRRLAEEPWEPSARGFIDRFVSEVVPAEADGQVRRAAQRFAVIAAAGELAARWGIVPWPEGEARAAATRLFREWVAARGGHEPAEIVAGIAALRSFLERHGSTRFAPWDDPARPVPHRAGFVRPGPERPTYYVLPEAWREILAGHDAGMIARELVRRGMLKLTGDGKPYRSSGCRTDGNAGSTSSCPRSGPEVCGEALAGASARRSLAWNPWNPEPEDADNTPCLIPVSSGGCRTGNPRNPRNRRVTQ